jgi:NitT/TauT family transport system permease protein
MKSIGVHAQPLRSIAGVLSWFLFAVGIGSYFYVAHQRHIENPDERVMPTAAQMVQSFAGAALNPAEDDMVEEEHASLWEKIQSSMLWKASQQAAVS